jgi:hypothetical protein
MELNSWFNSKLWFKPELDWVFDKNLVLNPIPKQGFICELTSVWYHLIFTYVNKKTTCGQI